MVLVVYGNRLCVVEKRSHGCGNQSGGCIYSKFRCGQPTGYSISFCSPVGRPTRCPAPQFSRLYVVCLSVASNQSGQCHAQIAACSGSARDLSKLSCDRARPAYHRRWPENCTADYGTTRAQHAYFGRVQSRNLGSDRRRAAGICAGDWRDDFPSSGDVSHG